MLATVSQTLVYAQAAPTAPPNSGGAGQAANVKESADIPKFRSRAELVLVPVVVRGKHGEHLSGLTKDSFRLEQNGKEQTIASVEEIQAEGQAPVQSSAASDGYSNVPMNFTGHMQVTILVLDLYNSTELQRADGKDLLIKFLSKGLKSHDPVSLLCITNKGVRSLSPFTSDTETLVRTLKELKTEGFRLGMREDIVRRTLEQLRQIAWAYAGVPGRKSLIWLSGDIPYPSFLQVASPEGQILRGQFDETRKSLLAANISVYPVNLLASAIDPTLNHRATVANSETMIYFGDSTGGHACLESNDLSGCLNEAVEDSRSYYMLSYAVKQDDRKPGWRDLKVKVSGEHGAVRARSGFYYEDTSAPSQPAAQHADEIEALASPIPATAVRFNVRVLQPEVAVGATSEGKKPARFLMAIPLESINIDPTRADALDIEVGAIALDKNGKEAGEALRPLKGNPSADAVKKLASEGIKLREELALGPGTYDVRFFVRDNSTGRIGTVLVPFEMK
jgi:VWFA-related protein